MAEGTAPAGWYPDTTKPGQQRYWDGKAWTEHVAPLAPTAPAGSGPAATTATTPTTAGPTTPTATPAAAATATAPTTPVAPAGAPTMQQPAVPGSYPPPGGYPPPGAAGVPMPGSPGSRTNALAIVSFVAGLIWICGAGSFIAVILGHVSLSQIKRTQEKGRGFAIAGLILGYIGVALTILAVVALAVGSKKASDTLKQHATNKNGVLSISGNKQHPPQDDVVLNSCAVAPDGTFVAHVTITNHSSGVSDYVVDVVFLSTNGNTQLGSSTVLQGRVAAGAVVEAEGGSASSPNGQTFTCKLTEADRFASTDLAPANP
jgi:hypothetical protein